MVCSTPSGIMESVTDPLVAIVAVQSVCSTPSGIMESVTLLHVAADDIAP